MNKLGVNMNKVKKLLLGLSSIIFMCNVSYATVCDNGEDQDVTGNNWSFYNFKNNMTGPQAVPVQLYIYFQASGTCQGDIGKLQAQIGSASSTITVKPGQDLVEAIKASPNAAISQIPTTPGYGVAVWMTSDNTSCLIFTNISWQDKITKKTFTQQYSSMWDCPAETKSNDSATLYTEVDPPNFQHN